MENNDTALVAVFMSGCAEGDAHSLTNPAGWEQLLGEGAVKGMQAGLAVPIVGQSPRLIVQQHPDPVVLRMPRHGLSPAIVPGAQLPLVQL